MQVKLLRLIPWFIIFPLIIALCMVTCQKQKIKYEVKTVDSTGYFKTKMATIHARGEAIKIAAHKDSIRTAKELQSLQSENKRLKRSLIPVRVEVEKIADTLAIVKQFLGLTDSLDLIQEGELDTMRAERIRNFKVFSNILSTKDEQQAIMRETISHLEALNKGLSKDLRRERVKKTVWKVVSGVLVAVVVYVSVKD